MMSPVYAESADKPQPTNQPVMKYVVSHSLIHLAICTRAHKTCATGCGCLVFLQ